MPPTLVVNKSEIIDWFNEGKTLPWMVNQYKEKYGLTVTRAMFTNVKRRHDASEYTLFVNRLDPAPINEYLDYEILYKWEQEDPTVGAAVRRAMRKDTNTISVYDVDLICCKVLKIHPFFIYPEWFDLAAEGKPNAIAS